MYDVHRTMYLQQVALELALLYSYELCTRLLGAPARLRARVPGGTIEPSIDEGTPKKNK